MTTTEIVANFWLSQMFYWMGLYLGGRSNKRKVRAYDRLSAMLDSHDGVSGVTYVITTERLREILAGNGDTK